MRKDGVIYTLHHDDNSGFSWETTDQGAATKRYGPWMRDSEAIDWADINGTLTRTGD